MPHQPLQSPNLRKTCFGGWRLEVGGRGLEIGGWNQLMEATNLEFRCQQVSADRAIELKYV